MYLENVGKEFPLKLLQRDNDISGIRNILSTIHKNCILDVKVKNASRDKLYRIEWFSNGYTNSAITHNRQIKLGVYDKDSYETLSTGTVYDVRADELPKENCTGIQYINCRIADDVEFYIIIDYDAIGSATAVGFNNNTQYGYNSIIDPSQYEYRENEAFKSSPLLLTTDLSDIKKPIAYVKSAYTNSNTEKLKIDFLSWGANELFAIYDLRRESSLGYSYSQTLGNKTDWIGPYIVKALTGVTGDDITGSYTGGVHGTKTASSSPTPGENEHTADTLEYRIFADGKQITTTTEIKAYDNIVIEVKNGIYAKNTILIDNPRYVMYENVRYTILPNAKIKVDVSIDVLEDVFMQLYYGLQCGLKGDFWDEIYFPYSKLTDKISLIGERVESGKYYDYPNAKEVIATKNNGVDKISIKMNSFTQRINKKSGINISNCFIENTKKVYFNTIHEVTLLKGFNIRWNGEYNCSYLA